MKLKIRVTPVVVLSGIIVVLTAAVVGLLLFIRNAPVQTRGIPPIVQLAAMEADSSRWGLNFPNQYSTGKLTLSNSERTTYGGSEAFSKLEADSRLVRLFAGYGFGKEYNEDRGHLNSLTDIRATKRINDTTPGSCYSCKSADNPKLWAEMGMVAYDKIPFKDLGQRIKEPIGCANCHEANTMRLIVTNPALDAALKAQGKDWNTFTRQEMRSVVCANCHVNYYFAGEGKLLTIPWDQGTTVDAIEISYAESGFSDWKHPDSGTPMIKIRHPDYELYTSGGTHNQAGVACADCHMPYLRDGAAKFSSHDLKSPLLNPVQSCGACHNDVEYVVGRVKTIQKQVADTMVSTEDALVAAIDAIARASAQTGVNSSTLDEARDLHRRAQMRWDFIAAENSMGFHNPEESLRILASAADLAHQAQLKALQAGTTGIAGN